LTSAKGATLGLACIANSCGPKPGISKLVERPWHAVIDSYSGRCLVGIIEQVGAAAVDHVYKLSAADRRMAKLRSQMLPLEVRYIGATDVNAFTSNLSLFGKCDFSNLKKHLYHLFKRLQRMINNLSNDNQSNRSYSLTFCKRVNLAFSNERKIMQKSTR
jgi:hypothetical protein